VGVWKLIRRGWETFSKFVRYEVGNRSKISFWHDLWCVDSLLNISYPDLFSFSRSKDVWVWDSLQFRDENIHWNVIVIRPIQDWEVEVVFLFLRCLISE